MPDAIVTRLNELGYQPIFLPLTGIVPPEVYGSGEGRLSRYGPLIDYVRDNREVSLTPHDSETPDITHLYTSRKKFSATLQFLAAALRCLGVSFTPEFSLSGLRDTHLVFAVSGLTARSVSPGRIQQVLGWLDPSLARHIGPDGGGLHIVHEYLYAERLQIRRVSARKGSVEGTLTPADFGELKVDASVTQEDDHTLAFAPVSGARVAFAYRAGWLRRDGSLWTFLPQIVRGATAGAPRHGPYIPYPGQTLWVEANPEAGAPARPAS